MFLCHSHADRTYVVGFVQVLRDAGWNAYVDWMDDAMPPRPDRNTAMRIRNRIRQCDLFMFLATPNSTASRWCPWEIGFADGVKPLEAIMVVPTTDAQGRHYGNEYLDLYRHVDFSSDGDVATWAPGDANGVRVRFL